LLRLSFQVFLLASLGAGAFARDCTSKAVGFCVLRFGDRVVVTWYPTTAKPSQHAYSPKFSGNVALNAPAANVCGGYGNCLCGRWHPGRIENANFRSGKPASEGILIGAQPPTIHSTRSFAILHASIFDAVDNIDGTSSPYLVRLHVSRLASQPPAADPAAHDVLAALYSLRT
jgi:hypothetical protein